MFSNNNSRVLDKHPVTTKGSHGQAWHTTNKMHKHRDYLRLSLVL